MGERASHTSERNNTRSTKHRIKHSKRPSSRYNSDKRFSKKATKPIASLAPGERKIVLLNKPFDVLTQFTDGDGRKTLADFVPIKDVYPAGRLDRDSEGLVLLTNDGKLQAQLTQPSTKQPKTYWVQVEGDPDEASLEKLRKGVELKDGVTAPALIERLDAPSLWDREPPVRFRAAIPTTWLAITITEGRNRQVRRMTANIGFPTLRLIRVSIGPYSLDGLGLGEYRVLEG